ncbi:Bug family tripartite tricarboxylate transporter substrate binding protein [Pseudorhodoferax sp.]|uniref:Bug family tripartite tricarboxylate transporter substrate binding protein n=1 Tax=Pseudorhodoferax sp. TaxID=1993553 RepID=UPI002DD62418|nr:tripartite tricarboxylate transporter substrate binding protein [Pseudorhodoferax sp.]
MLDRRTLLLGTATLLGSGTALAQDAAGRPIQLIVPFPAGGVTDLVSRIVAARLGTELGQSVVVDNRAGASGILGSGIAAKAAPDGHTLLMGNISTLAVNAATFAQLPYDAVTSFTPVGMVAVQPLLVAVHPDVPARTLAELIALAREKPGALNFGTAGSSIQLAVEQFNHQAGIRMTHVPYKGSAPAIADLIGGQVQVLFDPISTLYPQARSGKVRALAVSTAARSTIAPELPTVAEAGLAGYDVSSWQGIVAPRGTPPEAVARLAQALAKVLAQPEVQAQFAKQGVAAAPSSPQAFAQFIAQESARWQQVARQAGIRPE